jgi:nucleotide-binding universal stress UspA family protein
VTPGAVIVAIDGSDAAIDAARAALALLQSGPVVIATVVEPSDPTLVSGAGLAGGVMTEDELEAEVAAREAEGRRDVDAAAAALAVDGAETVVVPGDPGAALCDLAASRSASAIVMGSRGRGGIKRALLGSVSDFVVRNAPCPVIISRTSD